MHYAVSVDLVWISLPMSSSSDSVATQLITLAGYVTVEKEEKMLCVRIVTE